MKPTKLFCIASFALACSATLSEAAITVVGTSTGLTNTVRSSASGGSSFNVSFNAGATADAIVLSLSTESNATGGQVSITYAGFAFTPVIDQIGSQPSVWLLNLSDTTYTSGTATLTLDLTSVTVAGGYGLGFVSVATNDALNPRLGVHASNTSAVDNAGVSLTTTVESFAIAGHYSNHSADTTGATASAPMTQLYGAFIGSAKGAAGYQASLAAGTTSFSFGNTGTGTGPDRASAAAFSAIPEPSAALLGSLGLLALLRRRRA